MYEMKGVDSNRRSQTEKGACARDRPDFVPPAVSTMRWKASQPQLCVAPLALGRTPFGPASRGLGWGLATTPMHGGAARNVETPGYGKPYPLKPGRQIRWPMVKSPA
jgi:hypothetical protein